MKRGFLRGERSSSSPERSDVLEPVPAAAALRQTGAAHAPVSAEAAQGRAGVAVEPVPAEPAQTQAGVADEPIQASVGATGEATHREAPEVLLRPYAP